MLAVCSRLDSRQLPSHPPFSRVLNSAAAKELLAPDTADPHRLCHIVVFCLDLMLEARPVYRVLAQP